MPRMKDLPGDLECHFIKILTERYIAMFWALVRLLSCFSMDLQYVCYARVGRGIPSALGFRDGDGGPSLALAPDASRQEFGGTSTNILSANSLKSIVFDPDASTADGRQYVSMCCGQLLKVLGVKRWQGLKT